MGIFKIKADDFQWIGGVKDDPQDLCLHGHVTAQFGDTILEDNGTISATALYKSSVHVPWLLPLAHMETIVSVLVTSSVCLRFIVHYSSRLLGRG